MRKYGIRNIICACFINLELNSTQNSYEKYKKFINCKLPSQPKTSPNLKLCVIKIKPHSDGRAVRKNVYECACSVPLVHVRTRLRPMRRHNFMKHKNTVTEL